MVKVKQLVALALVIVASVVYWYFNSASEEQVVMSRLQALSSHITKREGEKPVQSAVKADSIGSLLDDRCGFSTSYPMLSGTLTSGEITSLALRARAMFRRIKMSFEDLKVVFSAADVAEVNCTAVIKADGEQKRFIDDYLEVFCILKKIKGRWVFSEFRTVQVLEK